MPEIMVVFPSKPGFAGLKLDEKSSVRSRTVVHFCCIDIKYIFKLVVLRIAVLTVGYALSSSSIYLFYLSFSTLAISQMPTHIYCIFFNSKKRTTALYITAV